MKTFNYHAPKDVKAASKLASTSSAFLAGGMTSVPSMKLGLATYKDVIDIKHIKKLSGIKVKEKSTKTLQDLDKEKLDIKFAKKVKNKLN